MKGRVLFLEPKGTILEVVRAAKRRGCQVTALVTDPAVLESLPSPYDSAKGCIDEIISIESWNEREKVLSLAEALHEKNPIVGIFFGVDPCAVVGSLLRKRFGLPSPAPEVMELALNKHALRKRLEALKLSKLKSFSGREVDGWDRWQFAGRAFFKPVHGAFSMYVQKCGSLEDVQRARAAWKKGSSNTPRYLSEYLASIPEYHLEEAFDGELMSIEAISHNGEFKCIGVTSRILFSKDPTVEMGSCFPYPHPLSEKIIEFVKRVHLGLGFSDGPTHTELIVNQKGEMEIIDFNPRFIGADVLQSINHAYGINIEEALLDWAIGREPKFSPKESNFSCIQYVLPPSQLTFESIQFPQVPEVKFSTKFLKPGDKVSNTERQIDYLGCYLTVLPGFGKAIERSKELRDRVVINNTLQGAF